MLLPGHPVTYNFYGFVNTDEVFTKYGGVDKFVRWRVRLMERAIERLDFESGVESIVQVHDYTGVSFFSYDPNVRQASRMIISLFQDHYPEFLESKCARRLLRSASSTLC